MKCMLVMDDWRQVGNAESIYNTPLGVELSTGDMHSGTTFFAEVELPQEVVCEIEAAWFEHLAYPVLRLVPDLNVSDKRRVHRGELPNAEHELRAVASRAPCEYDYCPECRGRFSFNKPVSGVCPWCGYHLPNAEHELRAVASRAPAVVVLCMGLLAESTTGGVSSDCGAPCVPKWIIRDSVKKKNVG